MTASKPHATDIRVKRTEKILEIDFEDGASFPLPAEYLRVESPSAEVQGHGPGQKTLVAGRRHVGIAKWSQSGITRWIVFDDLRHWDIFLGIPVPAGIGIR